VVRGRNHIARQFTVTDSAVCRGAGIAALAPKAPGALLFPFGLDIVLLR